jgi:hypothetical protein
MSRGTSPNFRSKTLSFSHTASSPRSISKEIFKRAIISAFIDLPLVVDRSTPAYTRRKADSWQLTADARIAELTNTSGEFFNDFSRARLRVSSRAGPGRWGPQLRRLHLFLRRICGIFAGLLHPINGFRAGAADFSL